MANVLRMTETSTLILNNTSYFQTFGLGVSIKVSVKFWLALGFRHRVYLLHIVGLY